MCALLAAVYFIMQSYETSKRVLARKYDINGR